MVINRIMGESAVRPPYPGEYTNPVAAFWYAHGIIKRRWPQGEAAIATDASSSCNYATYVLKRRFLRGEPAILKDPRWACTYAALVLGRRWLECEESMAKSEYATDYIQKFPEAKDDWVANGWLDWMAE